MRLVNLTGWEVHIEGAGPTEDEDYLIPRGEHSVRLRTDGEHHYYGRLDLPGGSWCSLIRGTVEHKLHGELPPYEEGTLLLVEPEVREFFPDRKDLVSPSWGRPNLMETPWEKVWYCDGLVTN